jgi:CxxC-x17-CxxC domain-containing protein
MNRTNKNHKDQGTFDKMFGNFRTYGNDFKQQKEMHKATCSECGSECDVPFKPIKEKAVYCRDCFRKKKENF